jgi:hypothetical protein
VRWVGKKADLFADEAVKKAGMIAGLAGGAWLVTKLPDMQAILKTAAAWLEPLIPLL